MGFFDLFKRKNPLQDYLDGFFKNMVIVDVVAASDIPLLRIDGNEPRRAHANSFFHEYARFSPVRINSFSQDIDAIFWIFDTFFVLEINATNEDLRQFIVLQLSDSKGNAVGHKGLEDRLNAMEWSFKILGLKEQLLNPMMELVLFKEAWDFFIKNHSKAIAIVQHKYY